jgi:Fungal specific transcription factor domain
VRPINTNTRMKERHKARHAIRDKRAGGIGLGVLETKSKHFKAASVLASASDSPPRRTPSPSTTQCQLSPLGAEPQDTDQNRKASNVSDSVAFLPHQPSEHWTSPQELAGSGLTADYLNSQLNYPNTSQMANMYMDQSPGFYEIGNMYHDMTFDLVHFNVTGFAPQLPDYRLSATQTLPEETTQSSSNESHLLSLVPSPTNNDSLIQHGVETQFSAIPAMTPGAMKVAIENVRQDEILSKDAAEDVIRTPIVEPIFSADDRPNHLKGKSPATTIPPQAYSRSRHYEAQIASGDIRRSGSLCSEKVQFLLLTSEKRDEVLEFIADIGPVRPDGTLIDGDSPDFSLENMQIYLDLFFEFFNTSYPLIHVATLDIGDTDPIALLSLMLLGATYKDKDAHQLSVCLYDAIVPYILSGLLSGPVPDLAILQAFLVLECYGMYRAGPYQRENAILIHGLLLNVSPICTVTK